MGLAGGFAWMNTYRKKRCRSLFWRVRAAVRKAVNAGGTNHHPITFRYDPSSYALNFDDGAAAKEAANGSAFQHLKLQDYLSNANTTWVLCSLGQSLKKNTRIFGV